jgi:hypothetical protein
MIKDGPIIDQIMIEGNPAQIYSKLSESAYSHEFIIISLFIPKDK